MPTYVYRCESCGTNIERRQRFQDPPLTVCEECAGNLRRVLQPVGIIFKGSGFYSTDYKSGAKSSASDEKIESATSSPTTSKNSDNGSKTTPAADTKASSAAASPASKNN